MRVTVIKNDGIVGVDGAFRQVDLSEMPEGVRVLQWDGDEGHAEFDPELNFPNAPITNFEIIEPYVDLWTAAAPPAPPEPTIPELIEAAHLRINAAYEEQYAALTSGYPRDEVASWPRQELEARAYLLDNDAYTPWLNGASEIRDINKANLAASIIRKADAFAPLYGAATGHRQNLRDAINALGEEATAGQLNAIVW